MPEPAWKRFERKIAKSLGVQRTPLSGSASLHTASDTLHPQLFVECKLREHHSAATYYRIAAALAAQEGKVPVLALGENQRKGALAVIDWEWFTELYEAWVAMGYGQKG